MTNTQNFHTRGREYKEHVRQLMHSKLSLGLKHILPNGIADKKEFHVGNVRGDAGRSLVVQLTGPKTGMWHDLAEKKGGDIFSLWAAAKGLNVKRDFKAVFSSMCEWLGVPAVPDVTALHDHPSTVPSIAASASTNASAVAATTPASNKSKSSGPGVLTGKWTYTDIEGKPIAIVSRYDSAAGKQFFPYDVKTGQKHAPDPRPLYNLPGIKDAQRVVIVEGEKAAQALIDAGICATTAMNGANAPIDKTDWSPLKYKDILIWPDNDEPGRQYAKTVADKLKTEVLHSLSTVTIPEGTKEKWDAADAVDERKDINAILKRSSPVARMLADLYSGDHAVYKTEPVPTDLVGPRILTEGGFCLLGGAPKAGKSDFLMRWLAHMATGRDFLGMKTHRPLRVAYLQAELRYHFICERIQNMMKDDLDLMPLFQKNFFFTPHMKMILDKDGVELMRRTILYHFRDEPIDVIAVDPLRYVFDGGQNNHSENDNGAMRLFLQDRIDTLRDLVNPNAANILVHHLKKINTEQLEDEEFQALSGAGVLHGHFSTGILMYRPDKTQSYRKLIFELRDGPPIDPKYIDKINGKWQRIEHASERLIGQEHGCKVDAEHRRKKDVILELIRFEARKGNIYTMNQFCEAFSNKNSGLGGLETVRRKLNVLATDGYIRFFNDVSTYGVADSTRAGHGYLCVENMKFIITRLNKETGETISHTHDIEPTHFKCRKSGSILPLEDKKAWQYFNEEKL